MTDKEYNTLTVNATGVARQQTGLGVTYSETRQVRDRFLDSNLRKENGRSAFYETSYNTIVQAESLLGELYGKTFSESVDNLYSAVAELAKFPSDSVTQGLFVQRAAAFLENAQGVYDGLSSYQDNMNIQIKEQVNRINEIGKQIKELNDQIVKIETGGFEHANDLRDTRNYLLDELCSLVKADYRTDAYGNTIVAIEGHDFVSADLVYEMELYQDPITGFYTPFWEMDASYTRDASGIKRYNEASVMENQVFNLERPISMDMNTDIGGLKAMLWARGDHRANYTDLIDPEKYNTTTSKSVLMNLQAEFDQLVHYVATSVNDIIAQAADTKTGYLCTIRETNGKQEYVPINVFGKIAQDDFTYGSFVDSKGFACEPDDPDVHVVDLAWHPVKENPNDSDSLYTTSNMIINGDLLKQPTLLSFRTPDGKEDRETPEKILKLFTDNELTLNPNVTNKTGITDYYSDLISQVSNSGFVYKGLTETQQATVDAITYKREELLGVSSDDELTQMVRYQNAYNASSRYINVISEMLEHLISTLGR